MLEHSSKKGGYLKKHALHCTYSQVWLCFYNLALGLSELQSIPFHSKETGLHVVYCFHSCARPLSYLGWWDLLSAGDLSRSLLAIENNWYHAAIAGQIEMIETLEARQRTDTFMRFPIVAQWLIIVEQFFLAIPFYLYSSFPSHTHPHKIIFTFFFLYVTNKLTLCNTNYKA